MKLAAALLIIMISFTFIYAGDVEDGKQIYEVRCTGCHQLLDPQLLRPAQWRVVMQTMQKRIEQSGIPPLTEEEYEKVLAYVIANASSD